MTEWRAEVHYAGKSCLSLCTILVSNLTPPLPIFTYFADPKTDPYGPHIPVCLYREYPPVDISGKERKHSKSIFHHYYHFLCY